MVRLQTVRESNAALHWRAPGLVAVVLGGTGGIGASTLSHLVRNLVAPVFYVIGRSQARFTSQKEELLTVNQSARIVFLEAEISLIAQVDAVCREILRKESRVDLLVMSAGMMALGGPHYTVEGIDKCAALSYYSRMRMTANLLPLLSQASSPRVLSMLAGGEERAIRTDDLDLKENYTIINVMNHCTTMHTLAWEHLASRHPEISFIHSHPGLVATDLTRNLFATPSKSGLWYSLLLGLFGRLLACYIWVFGMTVEEAGERQAFHATSLSYSAKGSGSYRLDCKGKIVTEDRVLKPYRESGLAEKIWEHTTIMCSDSIGVED